jgi:hypothetical protein
VFTSNDRESEELLCVFLYPGAAATRDGQPLQDGHCLISFANGIKKAPRHQIVFMGR